MARKSWLALIITAASLFYMPPTAAGIQAASPSRPASSTLLYASSWQHGTLGWSSTGHNGWHTVNGQLLFDGAGSSAIIAPIRLVNRLNYAVEATIQTTGQHGNYNDGYGFGLVFRAKKGFDVYPHPGAPSALGAGMVQSVAAISGVWVYAEDNKLASTNFDPGTAWHTYRVEVRGNSIRLLIDGQLACHVKSNQFLGNPRVGLYSIESEIGVGSFKVYGLP